MHLREDYAKWGRTLQKMGKDVLWLIIYSTWSIASTSAHVYKYLPKCIFTSLKRNFSLEKAVHSIGLQTHRSGLELILYPG